MSWPSVKLGECVEIVSGATPSTSVKENWDGNIFWATPKDLSGLNNKNISTTDRRITEKGLNSCSARILPKNSVLFSSRAPIGLVAINTVPMATNQGFKSFITKPDILSEQYLYYWLKKNREDINRMGVGATFKEVSKSIVSKIIIPLPPLAEQQRIAAILNKVDSIKHTRELALKKLEKFAQSQFVNMFSEIKEFQVYKLKDLCALITKGTTPTTLGLKFEEHGIPFIRAQNIIDGKISFSKDALYISPETHNVLKRSKIYPNDILISIAGTIGRSGIVGNEFGELNCNQAVAILRVNARVIPNFLRVWLESDLAKKQISSSTVTGVISNLSLSQIGNLEIHLPSLEIQNKFMAFIEVMDRAMGIARLNLKQLENLEASLTNTFIKDKK